MLQNKVLNKYKTKLQVWKHGTYCRYFYLNLKFLGWPYREYMKIAEMAAKYFLCGDDLDPVLAIFLSDGYGANTPEGVEEIAADEKDCSKCSLCVIVCIARVYQK